MYKKYRKKILAAVCLLSFILIMLTGCDISYTEQQNDYYTESSGTAISDNETLSETLSEAPITEESDTADTEITQLESVPREEETSFGYTFRNKKLLEQHFDKHGEEFDYATPEEYEQGANLVISNSNALHKVEAEDGDDIYYLEETNEFVVVSTDGYIRTYFKPSKGIEYFNRQ